MSGRAWTPPEGEEVEPADRAEWRRWLQRNHATARRVWLVSPKKSTGRQRLSYDDQIEEALCFGWVDSTVRRIDDERAALMFAPRRPGSTWAATNKARVARLTAAGLMADAGLRAVAAAQRDGSWTLLDDVEARRAAAVLHGRRIGKLQPGIAWIGEVKAPRRLVAETDRKSTRLNSSHT